MLEKCLNPACSAKFRSLRDGRVFVKEVEGTSHDNGWQHPHQPAYFWLCGRCCRTMTVVAEKGGEVRAMPLPASVTANAEKPRTPKNRTDTAPGERNAQ